ncbi:MAG: hypothetical protein ACYCTI_08575 [Acidimicrobiales bacterium]
MSPILLRDEDPPDDVIVVVRGGLMTSSYVRESATDTFDEYGIFAVSVFLAMDQTLDELCQGEPFLNRYGQVRRSTVGRLHAAGFALLPTLDRPHYDVVLPDLTGRTLDRLESSFDPPQPNPARLRPGSDDPDRA